MPVPIGWVKTRCAKPSGTGSRRPEPRSIGRCGCCRETGATACTRFMPSAAKSTTSPMARCRSNTSLRLSQGGARRSRRFTAGIRATSWRGRCRGPVRRYQLRREDFLAIIAGMEMDARADIRAPDLATLDLYCARVASAVGHLSVHVFGDPSACRPCRRRIARPGAAADQHPARPRRGCRSATPLSAARNPRSARDSRYRAGGHSAASGVAGGVPRRRRHRRRPLPGGRRRRWSNARTVRCAQPRLWRQSTARRSRLCSARNGAIRRSASVCRRSLKLWLVLRHGLL